MSTDNVTPIRPGSAGTPPSKNPKARRRKDPTAKQILAVVDEYQDALLDLESTVRCIKARASDACDELVGAIALVERELARIGEALEPGMIEFAIEERRRRKEA